GNALVMAAGKLREGIRTAAASRWGCAAEDVSIDAGKVLAADGRSLPLGTFGGTSAEATYASNKRTYSYGAHAAHVAVDPRTGLVELLDYVAVEDVGRIINPLTLHGQAVGAIVQGLGGTFLEHFVYDQDGQLLTGSFADYLLPTASDFPRIRAVALEAKPSPTNPLGAKGAGEGGIIPVGGVIANAVAAALGSLADYLMPTASDFPNIRAIMLELKPAPNNPLGAKGAGEGGIIPVGGVIANAVANALSELGIEPCALPLSPPRLWQLIERARSAPPRVKGVE
ncbi:MAG TPA: molybdopterin cofactor-binding domain-containing protein, partial [Stellaceae bacterium]|nr:molybdopterin cofactor-binding domain-containing protein [Stellaceae bacterium]